MSVDVTSLGTDDSEVRLRRLQEMVADLGREL
jgi:hypothetical protein